MGNVTSTLTMRLIDGISPVAPRVDKSLKGLDAAARKTAMVRHLAAGGAIGRGGVLLAGSIGGALAGAAGGYVGARAGVDAYKKFADYDRQITRILITAEAAGDQASRTRAVIRDIARDVALPVADVTAGLDTLVAAGRSLSDSLAFLPAVSRTAQAAGADVTDIAKSADALGAALKIPAERMEEAFDKMAKAGKLGKFELKDMAQYLPSLLPLASTKGFRGMEGLEKVVTYLQMIRQGTGSSEEAADSFRDMMGKIASSETVNKFKKFGIDIKKELASVRKAGGNEFDAMFGDGGLLERALKKGAQVGDVFQDIQAMRGALAYRQALGERVKLLAEVKDAAGTVASDLVRVNRDAEASVQRLSNAWDAMVKSFGNLGDAAGVTTFLETIAENNARGADSMERFVAALREGKSLMEAIRIGGGTDKETPEETQKRFEREMTGGQTLDEVGSTRSILGGARREASLAAATTATRKRWAKALIEAQRLAGIAQKYPDGKLPPILQAQADAARKEATGGYVDEADRQLVDASLGPNFDSRAEDVAHSARRGRSSPALPSDWVPLPQPRPDYSPAIEEARRAAAEIRAAFETINPVIRPRIELPDIPSSTSLMRKIDGSPTDNNGRR